MSESANHDAPDRFLAGCRAGDPAAQRRLYEACSPMIYRLALRMVGAQDAEDVTQQTFLRVFSRLEQFDGRAKFETWLYRLAVNESLQYLRKRRRWSQAPLDQEPHDASSTRENRTDQKEILEQAFSRLDPQLLAIFLLRESEGLAYREIAHALDIPEGTVGSRLNRARHDLQDHLVSLGWIPNDELH